MTTPFHKQTSKKPNKTSIATETIAANARSATVYFAWREGEGIVPEAYTKPGKKSFNRFFLETQILFFVVFIVFGTTIFIAISSIAPSAFWIAPLILIGIQFAFVFYSTRFIARSADWKITQANPIIHFLEYYLPVTANDFNKIYPRETLIAIKKEIYDEIIAKRGEVDATSAQQIFLKHGVPCELENLKAKKVNVYQMVKNVADRFRFPMPKVVVSNTMVPNAAASGPSPSRGLVLITTGLLVHLDEEEITSVLGHEFGHLRGRDPLILYGLVSAEFLFRFYVLLPLFPLLFSLLSCFLLTSGRSWL